MREAGNRKRLNLNGFYSLSHSISISAKVPETKGSMTILMASLTEYIPSYGY